MKVTLTILHAKRYDFTADDGRRIANCKVTAMTDSTMGDYEKGLVLSEMATGYDNFNKITEIPGHYEVDISIGPKKTVINEIIKCIKPIQLTVA